MAKDSPKRINVVCDVYKCGVAILIGDPDDVLDCRKSLADLPMPDFEEGYFDGVDGTTIFKIGEPDKVVWMRRWSIPILVHEAVHAASRILKEKGVDDEEALCYLTEHIVRTAIDARRNGRVTVL